MYTCLYQNEPCICWADRVGKLSYEHALLVEEREAKKKDGKGFGGGVLGEIGLDKSRLKKKDPLLLNAKIHSSLASADALSIVVRRRDSSSGRSSLDVFRKSKK